MIDPEDVALAREIGCTCAVQQSGDVEGHDAVFVTRRKPNCGKPAVWVCEWLDRHRDGRTEPMLGAACAEHHEAIVSGEYPLFDSAHLTVVPDWYRLPADPAGDQAWLAELIAAANPEREAASDG